MHYILESLNEKYKKVSARTLFIEYPNVFFKIFFEEFDKNIFKLDKKTITKSLKRIKERKKALESYDQSNNLSYLVTIQSDDDKIEGEIKFTLYARAFKVDLSGNLIKIAFAHDFYIKDNNAPVYKIINEIIDKIKTIKSIDRSFYKDENSYKKGIEKLQKKGIIKKLKLIDKAILRLNSRLSVNSNLSNEIDRLYISPSKIYKTKKEIRHGFNSKPDYLEYSFQLEDSILLIKYLYKFFKNYFNLYLQKPTISKTTILIRIEKDKTKVSEIIDSLKKEFKIKYKMSKNDYLRKDFIKVFKTRE